MDNFDPFEFLKIVQTYNKHIDDDFKQPSVIIPKLRPCQLRAVKWMINRETNNECELISFIYCI